MPLLDPLLVIPPNPASLNFGAGINDAVDCGASATAIICDQTTVCAWVKPTTLTSGRRILTLGQGGSGFIIIQLNGTGGNITANISRSVTGSSYVTNTTPLATLGKWYFVSATFDTSGLLGGAVHQVCVGDEHTLPVPQTFGTATDGVGTVPAATSGLFPGNRSALGVAWQGSIHWIAKWNRVLDQADIVRQYEQFLHPKLGFNTDGAILYSFLGARGALHATDWSGAGNHGLVSGAVVTADAPILV